MSEEGLDYTVRIILILLAFIIVAGFAYALYHYQAPTKPKYEAGVVIRIGDPEGIYDCRPYMMNGKERMCTNCAMIKEGDWMIVDANSNCDEVINWKTPT